MKKINSGIKLVVDNTQNKLDRYIEQKIEDNGTKSKSEFVNQLTSFCDQLDKQIEEIMNM